MVVVKDVISKDEVIESAKFRKMFMPSVDTKEQQQSRVVKGRGTPGQLLTPLGPEGEGETRVGARQMEC